MILVVPIGITGRYILHALLEPLSSIFGDEVKAGERLQAPDGSWIASRRQYMASFLLSALPPPRGRSDRTLGILDADLFAPGLNFVFGQASVDSRRAVISVTRLREEYYGAPPNETLFFERALKEAVHELGHTYGLGHCPDPRCVMHFSNTLSDTDRKGSHFCPTCEVHLTHMRAPFR